MSSYDPAGANAPAVGTGTDFKFNPVKVVQTQLANFFNKKVPGLNVSSNVPATTTGMTGTASPLDLSLAPLTPLDTVPTAPADPNGTATTPDKTDDISLQNAGLSALDTSTNAGLSKIDEALNLLKGKYAAEAGTNQANYQTQSDTNENNLQKAKQTALVHAAQGRQGLMGTLNSIGALSGSGIDLANKAVENGANEDLATGANTYSSNQSGLDTAIGQFNQDDKKRNDNADKAATDAKLKAQNEAAKTKQSFYTNLSNDYAAMGDKVNASKYTALAAALYPEIGTTNIPNSSLVAEQAAFTPGSLGTYMNNANNMAVSTTPSVSGSKASGLIASTTSKKKTN